MEGPKKRLRLAFVTNLPSHFHRRLFETIGRAYETDFYFFSRGDESWTQRDLALSMGSYSGKFVHGITIAPGFRLNIPLLIQLLRGRYDVYIHSINGRFELITTFVLAKLQRKPFILWTNLWFHPDTLFHGITFAITKRIYRGADAIVAYGYHVRSYLVQLGVDERKIFYSWNVTDNDRFNRKVSATELLKVRRTYHIPNGKVILFVGRLSEEKGLKILLEAFKRIPSHARTALVVVGSGPELPELQEYVRINGISNVHFVDYVRNTDLAPFYALAHIFVLPSITTKTFKEPWGIVLNEAMNQSVPIVATNAVGAAVGGLILEGKNGFVVPERNPEALQDALARLLSDSKLRNAMGKNAGVSIRSWDHNKSFAGFRDAISFVLNST